MIDWIVAISAGAIIAILLVTVARMLNKKGGKESFWDNLGNPKL